MKKQLLCIVSIVASFVLTAPCYAGEFNTRTFSVEQAREALSHQSMQAAPTDYALVVCNRLPNQPPWVDIKVYFLNTPFGNDPSFAGPGGCVDVSTDHAFSIPVNIYVPENSPTPTFSKVLNSGEIWDVTYDPKTGAYSLSRIQF